MFARSAVALLNHLLVQSSWAPPRLKRFDGRTLQFIVGPSSFSCSINAEGLLCEAADSIQPDAVIPIPLALLPRLALLDAHAVEQIHAEGEAELIEEVRFLALNLRWDAAEDISRFTGDVAAERLVGMAKSGHQQIQTTALNLSQALAEYWTEERPLLARPAQLDQFKQEVVAIHAEVEALEQRIMRLSKGD